MVSKEIGSQPMRRCGLIRDRFSQPIERCSIRDRQPANQVWFNGTASQSGQPANETAVFSAYSESVAGAPPLALRGATCEIASLYTKRKNVLRLRLDDGSEFLFMAPSQNDMVEWLSKIQFHAGEVA